MEHYCCELKCFETPKLHLDGIPCPFCCHPGFCRCECKSYKIPVATCNTDSVARRRSSEDLCKFQSDPYLRLMTFTQNSNFHCPYVSINDFVDNYFVYCGNKDIVQCTFCGIVIGHFERGDEIASEHRRHSPYCSITRGYTQSEFSSDSWASSESLTHILPYDQRWPSENSLNVYTGCGDPYCHICGDPGMCVCDEGESCYYCDQPKPMPVLVSIYSKRPIARS